MPKQSTSLEIEPILKLITESTNGQSTDEIIRKLGKTIPRRTLQRRLARLVEQKQLRTSGEGRARRYHLIVDDQKSFPSVPTNNPAKLLHEEHYVPLSPPAETIKNAVRIPLHLRHPVGYNRDFLDSYRPNKNFYLSLKTRQSLAELGRASADDLPAGTYARQIYNRLLIDLSWNSSRLEGNTYSLLETERLLNLGEVTEGKDAREAQMILNHKAAIELLVEQATEIGFNRYTVLNLHALLSDNLLPDPRACGRLRAIPVGIGSSVYRPLEVPQAIEECFQQILDTTTAIADPFEQAFFIMVHLPYLQPFEDVNKRVSRLAANISLIRNNFCPLSFVDVPHRAYVEGVLGIYELNRIDLLRDVFIWAYTRSCARYSAVRQSLGEPDRFRMQYRALLSEIIAEVVRNGMNKKISTVFVRHRAREMAPEAEQSRLIELIETELLGLHEGNIARYRIRPSEYVSWRNFWR